MPIQTVMKNLYLLSIPVPLPVHYTHCYALDTVQGWVIIDTGMDTEEARETWEAYAKELPFEQRGIHTVIITHFHPDHLGLAHWFHERFHARIAMSHGDAAQARQYLYPEDASAIAIVDRAFYTQHGVPIAVWNQWHTSEEAFRQSVKLPPVIHPIAHDSVLNLDPFSLRFLEQSGHTDHQILIYEPNRRVLFTGDQVLERISPNISLWPQGDSNPLASYLASLTQLLHLGPFRLGLPAHEAIITDVNHRILEIIEHHRTRNQFILSLLQERGAQSAFALMPLLFRRPLDDYQQRFALGETLAHLEYLRSIDMVSSSLTNALLLYSPKK